MAEIHVNSLRESISTYQYFNVLVEGLFRICSKNIIYRTKVANYLSENKYQVFKLIKGWITDSGNPVALINSGRLYYWKKATSHSQLQIVQGILLNMQGNPPYFLKKRDDRLAKLPALL